MAELNRDTLLNMSDEELLKNCKMDHYVATGNGGQKRNKTSSAVRLTLKDSSVCATASDDRQQSVNKKHALKRLRFNIALDFRQDAKPWTGQLDMNPKNPCYPLFIACITDNLFEHNWQVSEAAKPLNLSTGKLIKIISKNDTFWQYVNKERQKAGYRPLKK